MEIDHLYKEKMQEFFTWRQNALLFDTVSKEFQNKKNKNMKMIKMIQPVSSVKKKKIEEI